MRTLHTGKISILLKNEPVFAGYQNAPDEIKKRQLRRALAQLLQDIPVADLSIAAAAKYGELKYRRKRQLLTQSITSSTGL